jgi:hypothetical protein
VLTSLRPLDDGWAALTPDLRHKLAGVVKGDTRLVRAAGLRLELRPTALVWVQRMFTLIQLSVCLSGN